MNQGPAITRNELQATEWNNLQNISKVEEAKHERISGIQFYFHESLTEVCLTYRYRAQMCGGRG